jgi:hypothetical protein
MRKFLTSGRRRYALAFVAVGSSLGVMGAQCQPPKPPPPPTGLSISPTSHDFGDQPIGTESVPQTFTVTNNGPDTSGPLTVELQGGDLTKFTVPVGSDECTGKELAVDETCDVNATFKPGISVGSLSTDLVVTGDPGGSATAALTGNGVE